MLEKQLKENKLKEEQIKREVMNCKKCDLWKTRNNPVIGEGRINSNILFIGEAPGYWEDRKGKPFIGKAGEVLDELLASINLQRKNIYITNILKCRPPGNRNPLQLEIKACTPYLDGQIAIIQPTVIVTLGNFASSYIFEKFGLKTGRIGKIHGNIFQIKNLDFKVIPLYHPAMAVYNPQTKKVMEKDFKSIMKAENNMQSKPRKKQIRFFQIF